jgi:hypothetical protein
MALKDWWLHHHLKGEKEWVNRGSRDAVAIVHKTGLHKWLVTSNRSIFPVRDGFTKPQAEAYAKSWMRRH